MKKIIFSAIGFVFFIGTIAHSQDVIVEGSGSSILKSVNMSNGDEKAVHGVSKNRANYGYGGYFESGWIGLYARAEISGAGYRYAGKFAAGNGTYANYGIRTTAYGTNPYGIYSYAPSAGYAGYFSGNVHVTGTFTNPSDEKYKKDIKPLKGSLNRLMKLNAKKFKYKVNEYPEMAFSDGEKNGLIAQEVQEVFPELVKKITAPSASESSEDENLKEKELDDQTYLGVDYIGLIPNLVEAIKEQQAQIEELKAELSKR